MISLTLDFFFALCQSNLTFSCGHPGHVSAMAPSTSIFCCSRFIPMQTRIAKLGDLAVYNRFGVEARFALRCALHPPLHMKLVFYIVSDNSRVVCYAGGFR